MADNIRDRVLVLRVLSPHLLQTLNKKMAATEEGVNNAIATEQSKQERNAYRNKHANDLGLLLPISPAATNVKEGQLIDLEGVRCTPTDNGSTLWEFKCDESKYPARLVNLPCPVEVHQTYDHGIYFKCSDVGQMLIVYEDMASLEEAESMKDYKVEEFQSYFHSGLTPPMKKVVQQRFKAREHKNEPYREEEVVEVMTALRNLIAQIRPETSKNKSKSKSTTSHGANPDASKVEVVEDVEVPYESWMTNDGKTPKGIEFDETDALCYKHPELWLDPTQDMVMEEQERKKKSKKKKKETTVVMESGNVNHMVTTGGGGGGSGSMDRNDSSFRSSTDAPSSTTSKPKKGIASKKNRGEVDEVMQAALSIRNNSEEDDLGVLFGEDGFDFDGDDTLNFD